ncbi:MAG: proteinase [Edaphobacter sp.]|nr:proteinase [Edaphobacter sp.]
MNPTRPSCAHHSPIFTGLTISLCLFVVMGVHSCEARAVIADATPSNAWHRCGTNLECAQVPVPLDWDRPGDAKISLAVVRHLASKPNQKIGSLFVNFGGPGVASVTTAEPAFDAAELLERLIIMHVFLASPRL